MIFYIIPVVVLVFLFHILVFHEYHTPWYTRLINKIPGPSEPFFLGSTARFCQLKNEDILPEYISNFKKYGSTFRHWYSGHASVFVSDLDDVQVVLGSRLNSSKGIMYKHILPWLGTGLLTSSGEKWHQMRKIITPTFHFSILHGYIDVFNKNAKVLTEVLAKEEDSDEVDLAKYLTYCTLDNVCETAMGVRLDSLTGEENNYVRSVFRMGKILVHRIFSPIIFNDLNFKLSPSGWEFSRLLKNVHEFTTKVIEAKSLELSNKENRKSDSDNTKNKKSFLEMLLENQAKHKFTDVSIREEVDTFMFEGHDTTAAALNWALFELGHNVEVQEKIYDEVCGIFGNSDRSPTYQDLMEMTYTKRVIQEVLRLYPSVPVISRKFDVHIQIKNYVIPAHTDIVLILYYIHRNPNIFPEPDKFDPDRFLLEEVEKRHPFAYIPFSAGLRNCIGQKFAILEELVIISSILRKYKIVSLDDRKSIKVVPEMILRPSQKLRWKIIKR